VSTLRPKAPSKPKKVGKIPIEKVNIFVFARAKKKENFCFSKNP